MVWILVSAGIRSTPHRTVSGERTKTVMRKKSGAIRLYSVDEEGRFGGPECRITQIARALSVGGCEVETHVVYPVGDSERFARELAANGVPATAVNITRLSKETKILFKYLVRFPLEIFILFRLFRGRCDFVQVNGSQQFKGAIAAKLAGIPVVWVLEDALMNHVVKKICVFLAKHLADGIIVVGRKVYDYYLRGTCLELKPVTEILPPVNTAIFTPREGKLTDAAGGIEGPRVVTVSGINPTKGLEYFIGMAAELAARHPNLAFLVAAPNHNSQKRYYKALLDLVERAGLPADRFRFLGMVDDIPAFLQRADVFVCTSISESGPMAVWEAMAMGKPVVSTDVGSVSDYIKDGESGFVVPVGDSLALAEKVHMLLTDSALRARMGARAQIIAREKLDVSIAAEKYADFYRKLFTSLHV